MPRVKEITLKVVECPNGHTVKTTKTDKIQCRKCGMRFDL